MHIHTEGLTLSFLTLTQPESFFSAPPWQYCCRVTVSILPTSSTVTGMRGVARGRQPATVKSPCTANAYVHISYLVSAVSFRWSLRFSLFGLYMYTCIHNFNKSTAGGPFVFVSCTKTTSDFALRHPRRLTSECLRRGTLTLPSKSPTTSPNKHGEVTAVPDHDFN